MHSRMIFALAGAALLLEGAVGGQTRQGIDVDVRFAPVLAHVGGQDMLRYELRLINLSKSPLILIQVRILEKGSGREIANLSGDLLRQSLRPVASDAKADGAILEPGRLNLLFLDVALPQGLGPAAVEHHLTLSDGKSEFQVDGGEVQVASSPASEFGPPLKGGPWVAVYEPSMDGGHRRYAYAINGRATVPGRFAIDWFKVDEQGNQVAGTGAPVLAVADGVIVATRDDFADPTPTSKPPGSDLDNDTGNYVVLDLGRGHYAFYEHLKHGVKVKPGDKVRRGQVLGFLGATGHVTGPHLHFHIADANSPLDAEGVPYGFRRFVLLGRYENIFKFVEGGPWRPGAGVASGLPEPNAVVRFPD